MSAGSRWLASARASHTRALAAPQTFALTGDGNHTRAAIGRRASEGYADAELSGAALAEARYRDWYAARAIGTEAPATRAAAEPPTLTLTPDDGAAACHRVGRCQRQHRTTRVSLAVARAAGLAVVAAA